MPDIISCDLPKDSSLGALIEPGDFTDCYRCASSLTPREAAEIMVRFPPLVKVLLVLRNLFVAPFGLKSAHHAGEQIGIFPIRSESTIEILLGFDDKHLNFALSIYAGDGQIYGATWVHTHNLLGRTYLRLIMPFHIAIMRNALRRVADHERNTKNALA